MVNRFINVAVAEKLSALRTEDYFRERAARANRARFDEVLTRAGRGIPPLPGDELPRGRGDFNITYLTPTPDPRMRERKTTLPPRSRR